MYTLEENEGERVCIRFARQLYETVRSVLFVWPTHHDGDAPPAAAVKAV